MNIFTIGFTKSSAKDFFGRLENAGVRQVYDTRLNRTSQLSGFAKQEDLKFFLKKVSNIEYSIEKILAPEPGILDAYRKKEIGWNEYARRYLDLLDSRNVASKIKASDFHDGCLLCSEATPEHCHRRLAAEYLAQAYSDIKIVHL